MDLKENEDSILFLGIDELLDTRMATYFMMGEDVATKVIDFGYHDRITDIIPGVDREAFLKLYKARNKETLRHATVTPVGDLIKDFVRKTLENVINSPFHYQPRVVLNTYPYDLNEGDKETLALMLNKMTSEMARIDVIYRPIEKVTPLYIKNMSVVVMYDYVEWLEMHSQNKLFEETQAPEVAMFAPAVFFVKPKTKFKDGDNPFEQMNLLASPLIGLQLQPASLFSTVIKIKKKETQQT